MTRSAWKDMLDEALLFTGRGSGVVLPQAQVIRTLETPDCGEFFNAL
jgi:hypothetical protein